MAQRDSKGFQKGVPGVPFRDFLGTKATLHPTAYLVSFKYILGVLSWPLFENFPQKMFVGKRFWGLTFCECYAKLCQHDTGARPQTVFSKASERHLGGKMPEEARRRI